MTNDLSPLQPTLAERSGERRSWGRLYGSGFGLVISEAARATAELLLVITPDTPSAADLEHELHFYNHGDDAIPLLGFPDRETLPYDHFSPHQEIISERLATLYRQNQDPPPQIG